MINKYLLKELNKSSHWRTSAIFLCSNLLLWENHAQTHIFAEPHEVIDFGSEDRCVIQEWTIRGLKDFIPVTTKIKLGVGMWFSQAKEGHSCNFCKGYLDHQ